MRWKWTVIAIAASINLFQSSYSQAAAFLLDYIYGTQGANIIILGKIEHGDEIQFKKTVLDLITRGYWVSMVKIYSPGGSTYTALDIGRQIRTLKASTVAPTLFTRPAGLRGCYMPSGQRMDFDTRTGQGDRRCECASACFLIWAGGYGREGGVVGIHRPYFDAKDFAALSSEVAETQYEVAAEGVKSYLMSMDIPDYLIRLMFSYSSANIRYLTKQELEPISGLPPAIEELKLAKCGQRPSDYADVPAAVRDNYYNCAQALYGEVSIRGSTEYLRQYKQQ